jgi:predicted lipid-binding transport protein (Tim44 family)
MNNIPYIDILILAMIAVFIINRLKNALGKKTGNENDIVEKFTQRKAPFKESDPDTTSETIIESKSNKVKLHKLHNDKKINDSINNIIRIDENFEINSFLDGAKKAFEYILTQYSNNDLNSLKKLVSKDIFNAFENQIKQRTKKSETLEITVISVKEPKIIDVSIDKKSTAVFKLRFDSDQVQITKDKDDKIIDGDSNQILSIIENWTFSKNLNSNDPNWTLEKIEENN